MENIKLILEKMDTDKSFANEMLPLIEKNDAAEIVALAKKNGIKITENDWQEYIKWTESLSGSQKELAEDELEEVAGGGPNLDKGTDTTIRSKECWFYPSGSSEQRNGMWRKRCKQFACNAICNGELGWGRYMCRCWGTNKCVGSWHYDAGCKN